MGAVSLGKPSFGKPSFKQMPKSAKTLDLDRSLRARKPGEQAPLVHGIGSARPGKTGGQ